ncbi:MAG: carbohydrate ABC transporter permease [Planctomycetota bacterium]|nr:carbohydrate ABC transporter permease [Planctomycetota bacterium]
MRRLRILGTYVVLAVLGVTMAFPFYWMLTMGLKEPQAAYRHPPQWIPSPVKWSNFAAAWEAAPFGRAYVNSLIAALLVTAGQVFTSSLAAYAFSRLRFKGRDTLFFCYLATMMVPGAVTMIPVFILIAKIPVILNAVFSPASEIFSANFYVLHEFYAGRLVGLDSYFALIAPGLFSAYGTFMLRQYFLTIPRDYEEAAKIDGCSLWGIYWRIILPLSGPALTTLTIFTFMGCWKSFMWPLIATHSEEMKTLPVLLQAFQGRYVGSDLTLLMAASVIVLVPILVIFVIGQKHFMQGIRMGGLKG